MRTDYDTMPWLVTVTDDDGTTNTYGPYDKAAATRFAESFDEQAVAWVAQAPDMRVVKAAA